jgi:hypothetical protein
MRHDVRLCGPGYRHGHRAMLYNLPEVAWYKVAQLMCVYGSHEARPPLFSSSSLNHAGYETQILPYVFSWIGMFHVAESTVIQVAQKCSKMRYGSRRPSRLLQLKIA